MAVLVVFVIIFSLAMCFFKEKLGKIKIARAGLLKETAKSSS
jgi:hypothetical protein